jgi:hypothetical protein
MKMSLSRFPEEIVHNYNLNALAVNGWVYIEIRKGMFGLKQAVLFASQLLQSRLAPFGYYKAHHTPRLWYTKLGQSRSLSLSTIWRLSTWASSTLSISRTPYFEPKS